MARNLDPDEVAEKITEHPAGGADMERDGNVVFVDFSGVDEPENRCNTLVKRAKDLAGKHDLYAKDEYPADRKVRITVER